VFPSFGNLKEFLDIQQYFFECSWTVNGIVTSATGSSASVITGLSVYITVQQLVALSSLIILNARQMLRFRVYCELRRCV
jgi:hypothetical protein